MIGEILNDYSRCRVISKDLAVHWFSTDEDNAPCYCGATTRTPDDDDASELPGPAAEDQSYE